MTDQNRDKAKKRTIELPQLTDEEHMIIIEALAFYNSLTLYYPQRFRTRSGDISELQNYIRKNVQYTETDDQSGRDNEE